jgi:hypothetical protein
VEVRDRPICNFTKIKAMANLFLLRNKTGFDCWDYYDELTDVYVFGDRAGFKSLIQDLFQAEDRQTNTHLTLADKNPNSMRGVILPASKKWPKNPRLKFTERFVWFEGRPKMELVIFGNKQGYRYLRDVIIELMGKKVRNSSDYVQLNDLLTPQVVPRSISLNLRPPVAKWSRKALEPYDTLVFGKNRYMLPADLDYRLEEKEDYEEISEKESEFLRLDRKRVSH